MSYFGEYDWNRLRAFGIDSDFVERSLPPTYKKGLTKEEQDIAKREAKKTMAKAKEGKTSAKELYKDWESDKRYRDRSKKIPKSEATKAYERMFAEGDSGSDTALKNKAKESGIPLRILRQVFERGMAAWRSGHRPGVAPQQWALGRVNSFITGKGKARKADEDLWKKAKGHNFKECGESAIPDWKKCKKKVIKNVSEHVAQSVAAWKTGKVLGQTIASALESRYGIPREVSSKVSESVVQALTATALGGKHLSGTGDFFKKLSVEFTAAMMGKIAHEGAESALESKEIAASLERALPVLAGKFTGIGIATLGGRIPPPNEVGKAFINRTREDSALLLSLLKRQSSENFSESLPSEEYLADLSLLLLRLALPKLG